jgi:hypothetical protein
MCITFSVRDADASNTDPEDEGEGDAYLFQDCTIIVNIDE